MPDDLQQQLTQSLRERRAYGKYRGFVTDNDDPQRLARVKLRVPSLLGEAETDWALPCLPCGGLSNRGLFTVAEIGAQVWVEFEGGNLDFPIWTGTFWQQSGDIPEEVQDQPTTLVLRTARGHVLLFEEKDGDETVRLLHANGAKLEMDKDDMVLLTNNNDDRLTLDGQNSKVVLEDASGNTLTLDSRGIAMEDVSGNKLTMASSGITLSTSGVLSLEGSMVQLGGSSGEPVIKGTSLLTLLATHIHPSSMGPTGPPVPQGEMNSLSTKVTSA
ncbi:MAG: phage baseplate assembly protein V [Desulfobulbus sp.]|nr:phage baseplate assembly protein V [Desulfobulbus sp.]